jgi:hypothetical protein
MVRWIDLEPASKDHQLAELVEVDRARTKMVATFGIPAEAMRPAIDPDLVREMSRRFHEDQIRILERQIFETDHRARCLCDPAYLGAWCPRHAREVK